MSSPIRPRVAIIAAVAKNGIIGRNGTLPWHLPADLKHLKALTSGCRIIMGRRTWQSFPKPLPNREHIVVTSQALDVPSDVVCVRTLADALALANPTDPVFVFGGNALYAEAIALADDLYLTEIDADVEGDTQFPSWDRSKFREVSRESHEAQLQADAAALAANAAPTRFDFVHYARR
jgi:dihydrofolate reductase